LHSHSNICLIKRIKKSFVLTRKTWKGLEAFFHQNITIRLSRAKLIVKNVRLFDRAGPISVRDYTERDECRDGLVGGPF
jgi:hypothetical protein